MKLRLYREFGAGNSGPVFDAFEAGLSVCGDEVVKTYEEADAVVIWSVLFAGRMSGNEQVWKQAHKDNKPVIVLEVGALKRGESWKVGVNGINRVATFCDVFQENRFEQFGITLQPWKETTPTGFVTIFTQRPDSNQWAGLCSVDQWVNQKIKEIRKVTTRKILVRPHPRDRITDWRKVKGNDVLFSNPQQIGHDAFDHALVFRATYAAVNFSSGPSIQTVLSGIHTVCSEDSLAFDVSEQIENIETPTNPDRTAWCEMMAHTEWFVDEIAKGIPWKQLRSQLSI